MESQIPAPEQAEHVEDDSPSVEFGQEEFHFVGTMQYALDRLAIRVVTRSDGYSQGALKSFKKTSWLKAIMISPKAVS